MHHFKSICEFKLELQSRNAQFRSKLVIFLSCVTLKFDGWPWKNGRAPLLYYIKLCAAFQSHWYIQTGVTVQKRSIRAKIGDFLSCVTLKIDGWPWRTIGHLSYAAPSFLHHFIVIGTTSKQFQIFVHHFIIICEFKLELRSGKGQMGSWPLLPWPLISDREFLHGHHVCRWQWLLKISGWYEERNIVKRVWRTDRQTDGSKCS